jgi:hypothetical protein
MKILTQMTNVDLDEFKKTWDEKLLNTKVVELIKIYVLCIGHFSFRESVCER